MKVWRFYKKPTKVNEIPETISEEEKFPLYAITNDKKLAKEFMKTRDMSIFTVKKDTEVGKSEYAEIVSKNRSALLVVNNLITSKDKYTNKQVVYEVPVVMTTFEKITVNEPVLTIDDEQSWMSPTTPSPYIFNNKILKALKLLDYEQKFRIFNLDYSNISADEVYDTPSYYVDTVEFFVDTFGETLK